MENWLVAVIGLAICVAAILVVSAVKVIVKKIKKNDIDMKKAEYPLCFASLVLAYGGVVLFLYFGVCDDIYIAMKTAIPFALSVQSLYVFVVQLARKGFTGVIEAIKKLISKLKSSKNPVMELPAIVAESTEESTAAEETAETLGKKLYEDIFSK